jgi:hypothetical protein
MWSVSISSVKVSGIPIGLATSRHAPETETLRTRQLIVLLSNAITPAFRVRRRTLFSFSATAKRFDAKVNKKVPRYCSWVSLSARSFDDSLWSIVPNRIESRPRQVLPDGRQPSRPSSACPGRCLTSAFSLRARHHWSKSGCLRAVQQPRIFCGSDGEVS